jgi:hypothetical protein
MPAKKYKGSCYIGVVGSEMENGQCRDSIEAIQKRDGDAGPYFIRATKGYEARQMHLNKWYDGTKHAFMLLLDHDMIFPRDTLEHLRKHGLPYVSGYYMRRTIPTAPIWFDNNDTGRMPMRPMTAIPADNMLYPIGASGWGCILMHRDVVTATRKILKGEPEIIEDDMDVWPYDLPSVLNGTEAIKPLRGVKDIVGSDIRFPFYAKQAGFQLWGDSGVRCMHMAQYPIKFEDYAMQNGLAIRDLSIKIQDMNAKETARLRKAVEG